MLIAGIMSGTSADGVDVALVDLRGSPLKPRWKLAGFQHVAFSRPERVAILRAAAGKSTVGEIARLNITLARRYAAAVQRLPKRPELIACHGQTVFHEGGVASMQLGDAATLAAACRAPVVSNFRAADIAAGGQGAPLAPFGDWVWLRHAKRFRVALNLGGIANVTLLPPGCTPDEVTGFDTGPANMVLDALAMRFLGKPYDRDGRMAARGGVIEPLLRRLLADRYFKLPPPKSAGREQFGAEYVARLLKAAGRARPEDVMATAVALTARTVAAAMPPGAEVVVSGGGAHNRELMRQLGRAAPRREFTSSDTFGIPWNAKEAMLFALLGYAYIKGLPANLPLVTGARFRRVLGQFTPFESAKHLTGV